MTSTRCQSDNFPLRSFSSLLTLLTACFFIFFSVSVISAEKELLKPEQAFKASAESIAPDLIQLNWDIEEAYYLYKDRFKFSSGTEGVELGEPIFPKGKFKHDEFFGDMEVFYKRVNISIPLIFKSGNAADYTQMDIKTVSQGCADAGLCYPPQKQTLSISLMPSSQVEKSQGGIMSALASIGINLGGQQQSDDLLRPEQAFILSLNVEDGNTIRVSWDIASDYYLYRDKFSFAIKNNEGITLDVPIRPAGKIQEDESFGRMEVYYNRADILLPLSRSQLQATEIELEIGYQGCADIGFCYPPIKTTVPVKLPAGEANATPELIQAVIDETFVSEQDLFAKTLSSGNILIIVAAFFVAGLALSFTPCVFPMIPILSSIVVGQKKAVSTPRAFALSMSYVQAMALTYTSAGVIAGFTGHNLQATFQNPWILSVFAILFVLLSLSMFGFYNLQIPSSWQNKLNRASNSQSGGTLTGAAIMGFLSALIVGPCVAAPLIGALVYISQSADAVLGGVALYALSMGMGTPLLIIGTSAGKLLPKAGGWMDKVKAFFGFVLLGVAIWMLERIIPAAFTLSLWAILAISAAIYMGVFRRFTTKPARQIEKAGRVVSVLLLSYGGVALLGAATGGYDPLRPLEGSSLSSSDQRNKHIIFIQVKGLSGLNAELAAAKAKGQTVMFDFYADWCVSCKEMEKYTFTDTKVQQALDQVVLLQTDVTSNDEQDQALMREYGILGPPAILFFDASGAERKKYRVVGFMDADDFARRLTQALP